MNNDKDITVSIFTFEANNISEKNREDICTLIETMMDDYNDVAFEPLGGNKRVQVDTYEVG